jgi:putative phosphoribosyl transferase
LAAGVQPKSSGRVGMEQREHPAIPNRETGVIGLEEDSMPMVEKQWTTAIEQSIEIEAGAGVCLAGELIVPEDCYGTVVFAHGSEMSRFSSGSLHTVRAFEQQGLAVVAFDLLGSDELAEEICSGKPQLDVPRMASRYLAARAWVGRQPELRGLPWGILGTGIGAAGALVAAAERPGELSAVVCQSGRLDLPQSVLGQVSAPTLLIVDAADGSLIGDNERSLLRLGSDRKELVMIPAGASRFDESPAHDAAASLAAQWFSEQLILAS